MAEIQQTVQNAAAVGLRGEILRACRSSSIQMLVALVIISAVMTRIEFAGPAILDNDGYYHIRFSKLLWESAPHLPRFTYLPLTTLSEDRYVDHHFLFHILLVPFTFGDLRLGAKLAAILFSALGLTMSFWLLVAYRVRFRWVWLVGLVASSEPFLYRMAMTRDPSLSLLLLGLGSYTILKRRWVMLGVLGFVFVWLYSLFPLLFALASAYSVALYIGQRRIDLWPPVSALTGIVAGLIVNPYFPKNITLFIEHLKMKLSSSYAVDVGVEWYPYDTWVILGGSAVAFAIFFAGLLAFDIRARVDDIKPLFFLIVSSMLLLMSFKSRRFIEYWPPFAVLFAAFTLDPKLSCLFRRGARFWHPDAGAGQSQFIDDRVGAQPTSLDAEASRTANVVALDPVATGITRVRDRVIVAVVAAVITQGLVLGMISNIDEAGKDLASEQNPYAFRGAGQWLAEHTPPGSVVFNTDWDEFPMLFYYNTNNSYIVGLDPTYLYDRDHGMWKEYADITLGNVDDPGPAIRDRFGANYVVTDNAHTDFMDTASQSGGFEKVFSDEYATVLRVKGPNEPRTKTRAAGNNDASDSGDDSEDDDNDK
jgi:hypothetical protein